MNEKTLSVLSTNICLVKPAFLVGFFVLWGQNSFLLKLNLHCFGDIFENIFLGEDYDDGSPMIFEMGPVNYPDNEEKGKDTGDNVVQENVVDDVSDKSHFELVDVPSDKVHWKFENVTPKDKFKLAARILAFAAVFFVVFALLESFFSDHDGVEKVWDFASVALNSIVSLIIGYYFGTKDR